MMAACASRKFPMFSRYALTLAVAAAIVLMPTHTCAQAAFDTAANYTDTWKDGNQGTGFLPFFVTSFNGLTASEYTVPVASAASYGGDAGAMDSSGKSFIINVQPDTSLNAMVYSYRPVVARGDGLKISLKAQSVGGKMQVSFPHVNSGRFGRVMTDNGNWLVRLGSNNLHVTPFAGSVPVQIDCTFYGSQSKWDASITNLQTSQTVSYTDIPAELRSGDLQNIEIYGLAQPAAVGNYIFNDLKVTPGPSARVEDALSY